MLKIFKKLFGTKSERDIKAIQPYIAKINKAFEKLSLLSNDELREKTVELKKVIAESLRVLFEKIQNTKEEISSKDSDLARVHHLQEELVNLEKEYDQQLEVVLLEILPQAFAIVKETCRRFSVNPTLETSATDYDCILSITKNYVKVDNGKAIWQNHWDAHGTSVVWDMVPYDVQLIGGIILHEGKIAEMATGEGKTLTSILPIFLNALAGSGVHVITVNDYLAQRDSEWMGPIFQFHGLTVDCIDRHDSQSEARKKAYKADIVYGTNNEFGFDYLRDNMATEVNEIVQQKLHFAIVDEVDSVLIDDARTPLIISGPVQNSNEQEYAELKPVIDNLVEEQKNIVTHLFNEAKSKIASGNIDEGGLALFRVYRGLPKFKPLIKFLSEKGNKQILYKTENHYLQDSSKLMPEADQPLLFTIEEKNNSVELTEKGLGHISKFKSSPDFFVLPDIGSSIASIESNEGLDIKQKIEQKEVATQDFIDKSQRIHVVKQLLKAYTLFEINVDYIIKGDKVRIVDEQTGRILEGRRYSDGLHQALEAKENVKIQRSSQTYATITLQNYFRMYHKLSGMTGTASTEAGEFWEIYKLDVVDTPTHRPLIRADKEDMVYKTMREKFNAVIEEINKLIEAKRPVLVGTTSVEISELISRMLAMRKIPHQVLNAKHHDLEAEIVANAGKEGTVTIATNMAGRGTDIKLTPESKNAGGLAIVGTERHESRRVDRQLRGRSGRQGDVGSSQFFVSLEDPLMRLFGSERLIGFMDKLGLEEGEVIQHSMVSRSIEKAQQKVEQGNFATRKRLLEYDNIMNSQRSIIYKKRNNVLKGQYIDIEIKTIIYDTVANLIELNSMEKNMDAANVALEKVFGINFDIKLDLLHGAKPTDIFIYYTYKKISDAYELRKSELKTRILQLVQYIIDSKEKDEKNTVAFRVDDKQVVIEIHLQDNIEATCDMLLADFEKATILMSIDNFWRDHLREMDELKQAVQNAVYERQDPLLIYKIESYELFQKFIFKLNKYILEILYKAEIFVQQNFSAADIQKFLKLNDDQFDDENEFKDKLKSLLSDLSKKSSSNALNIKKSIDSGDKEGIDLKDSSDASILDRMNRNDRVSVKYLDGSIKENIKFKSVEEDVKLGKCKVLKE